MRKVTEEQAPKKSASACVPERRLRARLAGTFLASVLLASIFRSDVATYAGKPNGDSVPAEAVPIYAHPDISFGNKIFEYLFPTIAPIGNIIECPVAIPDADCMANARDTIKSHGAMVWRDFLNDGYAETVVSIKREDGTSTPLEVVLLHPVRQENESATSSSSEHKKSPLVLWMHGGGFVVGSARDSYLRHLLKGTREVSSAYPSLRDAVWASVDYRLAPDYPFPAALEDCRLALDHLLNNKIPLGEGEGVRLGTGGVHLAGVSAGATLTAKTALWALQDGVHIDSIFIDEPAFSAGRCPTDDFLGGRCNPLDSESYRRNAFTRIPPFHFLDWAMHAYSGCPPANELPEDDAQREQLCRKHVDFFNGTLSVDEWRNARTAQGGTLPAVVVLTAKADILHDLAFPFIEAFTKAAGGSGQARLHHIDAAASHSLPYVFDPEAGRQAIDVWGGIVHSAVHNTSIEMETMLQKSK